MFTSLIEALPLAAFILDRSLKIVQINAPALELCGRDRLSRYETLDLLLKNDAITHLARECVHSGETQRKKIERVHSNITWLITVAPLKHRGSSAVSEDKAQVDSVDDIYFLLTIEDMAELQRLER